MGNITKTTTKQGVSLTGSKIELGDLRRFVTELNSAPADTVIKITVYRGDQRDPGDSFTLKASWEPKVQPTLTPRMDSKGSWPVNMDYLDRAQ